MADDGRSPTDTDDERLRKMREENLYRLQQAFLRREVESASAGSLQRGPSEPAPLRLPSKRKARRSHSTTDGNRSVGMFSASARSLNVDGNARAARRRHPLSKSTGSSPVPAGLTMADLHDDLLSRALASHRREPRAAARSRAPGAAATRRSFLDGPADRDPGTPSRKYSRVSEGDIGFDNSFRSGASASASASFRRAPTPSFRSAASDPFGSAAASGAGSFLWNPAESYGDSEATSILTAANASLADGKFHGKVKSSGGGRGNSNNGDRTWHVMRRRTPSFHDVQSLRAQASANAAARASGLRPDAGATASRGLRWRRSSSFDEPDATRFRADSAGAAAAGASKPRSNDDLLLLEMLNDTVVSPSAAPRPRVDAGLFMEKAFVDNMEEAIAADDRPKSPFSARAATATAETGLCVEILPGPPLVAGGGERGAGGRDRSRSPFSSFDRQSRFGGESESGKGLQADRAIAGGPRPVRNSPRTTSFILGTFGDDGDANAMPPPPPFTHIAMESEEEDADGACVDNKGQAAVFGSKPPKESGKKKAKDKSNHVVTPSSATISALSAQIRDHARTSDGGDRASKGARQSETDRGDEGDVFSVPQYASYMEATQASQQAIHDWDRKFGLRRAHSKTMRESCRSRKKVLEFLRGEGASIALRRRRTKEASVGDASVQGGEERPVASNDGRGRAPPAEEERRGSGAGEGDDEEVAADVARANAEPLRRRGPRGPSPPSTPPPTDDADRGTGRAPEEKETSKGSHPDGRNAQVAEDADRLARLFRRASLDCSDSAEAGDGGEEDLPRAVAELAAMMGRRRRPSELKQFTASSA